MKTISTIIPLPISPWPYKLLEEMFTRSVDPQLRIIG